MILESAASRSSYVESLLVGLGVQREKANSTWMMEKDSESLATRSNEAMRAPFDNMDKDDLRQQLLRNVSAENRMFERLQVRMPTWNAMIQSIATAS